LIQDGAGTNYSTGLTHVSTDGVVSTGSSALGKTTGTLYWKIPQSISGTYRYQCSIHAAMVGSITIRDFAVI
jgi:plastocyanin